MPAKHLPNSPSLIQLKHQAKDLRNAYRAGDSDAVVRIRMSLPGRSGLSEADTLRRGISLQDAQTVIAKEYGFSSWARLKRHVEALRNKEERPMSEALQQFKDAVISGEVEAVKTVLNQHPDVKSHINDPMFYFDAPAIVLAKKNRALVDCLLDFGADINAKSNWEPGGYGVLHDNDLEMVDYLISRGAEVDIHAAAQLGLMDRVKTMVEAEPALVHAKGPDGQRPLHFANSTDIIDYLLDQGADINARCVDHQATAAQYAVNDTDRCRYLIEKGAEVDIFMACALGDVDLVKSVIEANPESVDGHTPQGFARHEAGTGYDYPPTPEDTSAHIYVWTLGLNVTPHMVALRKQHPAVHALLLEHSSPLRRLIDACIRAENEVEEQILVQYPDLDRTISNADGGVLAGRGLYEYYHNNKGFNVADAILTMYDAGFDIALRGEMGATPLHWASWYGSADAVQHLLERGAPLEIHDTVVESTPLQWAVHGIINGHHSYGGHMAIIQRLLAAGADANVVSVPTGNREVDALVGGAQISQI